VPESLRDRFDTNTTRQARIGAAVKAFDSESFEFRSVQFIIVLKKQLPLDRLPIFTTMRAIQGNIPNNIRISKNASTDKSLREMECHEVA